MRVDCHVHLDPIGPPHKTQPVSCDDFWSYTRREAIGLVAGIYDNDETLKRFSSDNTRIFAFYWERQPLCPNIPFSANGLKLHPYIENYVLGEETVGPSLDVARQRGLPVLIHSDDRKPELSRGRHFAELSHAYPEIHFIIAHAGAYAPEATDNPLVEELVTEAIAAAKGSDNVWLEVSVLRNSVKARLIAKKAPLDRVLLGSDFPIRKEVDGSILFQEAALRNAGLSNSTIEQFHVNAEQLLQ